MNSLQGYHDYPGCFASLFVSIFAGQVSDLSSQPSCYFSGDFKAKDAKLVFASYVAHASLLLNLEKLWTRTRSV